MDFLSPNASVLPINVANEVKIGLIGKDDFVRKIDIHFLLSDDPNAELTSLWIAVWQKLLGQL